MFENVEQGDLMECDSDGERSVFVGYDSYRETLILKNVTGIHVIEGNHVRDWQQLDPRVCVGEIRLRLGRSELLLTLGKQTTVIDPYELMDGLAEMVRYMDV